MDNLHLVTGACGYIGSNLVWALRELGLNVIAFDNLSSGSPSRLPQDVPLIVGDLRSTRDLEKATELGQITSVFNLAALKSPEESMLKPDLYHGVNSLGVQVLLDFMKSESIGVLVQSSSSSVYGNLNEEKISESCNLFPISPYGKSKLDAEERIRKEIENGNIRAVNLRFFNVVGASKTSLQDPSSFNLFPKVIRDIRSGERPKIFGRNYPTIDGTCIRDYIHVEDIVAAHIKASRILQERQILSELNLGTGVGYSVLEIVTKLVSAINTDVEPEFLPRREGDPAKVIADVTKAHEVLGFKASRDLNEMVTSSI